MAGGEKGPRDVLVLQQQVQTKEEQVGPNERPTVIKTYAKEPQVWHTVSNAAWEVRAPAVAVAHGGRHGVEELFEQGNQEVGMSHYEVRSWSWSGWRWEKNPERNSIVDRGDIQGTTAPSAKEVARKVSEKLRRTEEARVVLAADEVA